MAHEHGLDAGAARDAAPPRIIPRRLRPSPARPPGGQLARPRGLRRRWADLPLQRKAFVVAGIPVFALLLVTGSFLVARDAEDRASAEVSRALQVDAQLQSVLGLLVDAETGVRGYLLTANSAFLAPSSDAIAERDEALGRLAAIVADDAQQLARVRNLETLVDARIAILDQTRDARRTGSDVGSMAVLLEQGREAMDLVRAAVAEMAEVQAADLAARRDVLADTRARAALVVGAATTLGLIGGGFAALLLTAGIIGRVRRLEANAERLTRGEPSVDLPPGDDEIGRLGATLAGAGRLIGDQRERLREAQAFLEHLIETGPVVMLRIAIDDLALRYVSPNAGRILGDPAAAMTADPAWWVSRVQLDDQARIAAEVERRIESGDDRWESDWRYRAASGAWLWLEGTIEIERSADGTAESLLVYGLDVTARREAEVARDEAVVGLRDTLAELDDLYNRAPCGYHSVDADGAIVRINDTELAWLGFERDELVGRRRFEDLLTPDSRAAYRRRLETIRTADSVPDLEFELVRKDGTILPVLASVTVVRNALGEFAGTRSTLVDLTARREADASREAAREAAEDANAAKSEFLSRMSHELRTPLNAVLGFAQLLELDDLADDQRENVGYIFQAGRHLVTLIDEVLDISRIETGRMTISPEPVAVDELVAEVAALVRPLADERELTIDASIGAMPGVHVTADRQRLKQVLINLLSNAVKYNRDRGQVTVARTPLDDGWLRISVGDTGYGIPADLHERLFNPFDRLGAERGSVEGTGLGLALSKGLVEAMGGRLSFTSETDVGSTFSIDLATTESALERFERTAGGRRGRVAATTVAARTILHIEDNRTNQRLVERIVGREGLGRVIEAVDAAAGLRLAREARPDLVLLDLHLPDADGRAVLRDLQRRPETRAIPVVVLSADGSRTQIRRLLAAGAVGYLTKPIQVEEFVALLERLLGSTPDVT